MLATVEDMIADDKVPELLAALERAKTGGVTMASVARAIDMTQPAFAAMIARKSVWKSRREALEAHLAELGFSPDYSVLDYASPSARRTEAGLLKVLSQAKDTAYDRSLNADTRMTLVITLCNEAAKIATKIRDEESARQEDRDD